MWGRCTSYPCLELTVHTYELSLLKQTFVDEQKNKGTFQHSSFLAGGATTAAGRLVAKEGRIEV